MNKHKTTGRWQLGLGLALFTVLLWSTLPVALKVALQYVDPFTLTWFRFLVAALAGLGWLAIRGKLSQFLRRGRKLYALLSLAAIALIGNYVLYILSLQLTTPANAQVLIQVSPILMAMGGLLIFGERYRAIQWLGMAILIFGMGLFFNDQIRQMGSSTDQYLWGAMLMLMAAISWAAYALIQKQLLQRMGSEVIMIFIYVFASIALLPTAVPGSLGTLGLVPWVVVIFCAFNTVGAYGAFAEALNHWEVSRVSAILSLTPLGALLSVYLVHLCWPDSIAPEQLDLAGWIGAMLVVAGSVLTSLGGRRYSP